MDPIVYFKCAKKSNHKDEHNIFFFSALYIYGNPCNILLKKNLH